MSKDNVKQMFGKMEKDAALKNKYAELMQAHQIETEKALADKLIELGKTAGFKFSKDDLMASRAELADKINENKELSDDDLANVAGGENSTGFKSDNVLFSLGTIGLGCAVLSVKLEANSPGACGSYMSTTAKCL